MLSLCFEGDRYKYDHNKMDRHMNATKTNGFFNQLITDPWDLNISMNKYPFL